MTNLTKTHDKEDQLIYRQGDVLIQRVDSIPSGLSSAKREKGRIILAEGEVTGHAHAIAEREAELFVPADLDEMADRFLRVGAEVAVEHEEHDTIALPPGDYRVRRQREYSPEEIRVVGD